MSGVETALDQAFAVKRFDVASNLSTLAKTVLQRVSATHTSETAAGSADEYNETAAQYENAATAFDSLVSNPTDANANLMIGMYFCFGRGEWNTGLPMLAVGSDDGLKLLAGKDLAEAKSPTQEAQLGDEWWQFADTSAGPARIQAQVGRRIGIGVRSATVGTNEGVGGGTDQRLRVQGEQQSRDFATIANDGRSP